MKRNKLPILVVGIVSLLTFLTVSLVSGSPGDPPPGLPQSLKSQAAPECNIQDPYFLEEVWAKVGERICLNCHNTHGDASASAFILQDSTLDREAHAANLKAFTAMASAKNDSVARLLAKPTGSIKHGGGAILKPDTPSYRILSKFIARVHGKDQADVVPPDFVPGPYYDGIAIASPQRLLRRVTLSLGGRLPTVKEVDLVEQRGLDAIEPLLDTIMKEDAFFTRLREGFNDIFLTLGYPGNADDALSYEHFEKTRHWYQKHDFSKLPEKERQKAEWALANTFRKALLREPLELVVHLVRNDLPFTGLVTADYIMVSPYTARGYGIYEENQARFKNTEDPYEYIPAKLRALTSRNGKVQPSDTGNYPHAGILTTFQYLRRYPTTVTNRNRLRARMYYQHFLGVDVMALAPRVMDAAAVSQKHKNPTLEASECVVCHKTIDPVAGLFRDYFNEDGYYGPRKEGWFTDMFAPGLEGVALPRDEGWRALQWLGAATAKDPRFAVAMVEHVYTILMGRRPLLAPQDIDDPFFTPKRRAFLEQRKALHAIADKFTKSHFNLKIVFKALIMSPFYQADGLREAAQHPRRRAELHDIGLFHMLTPEQLERKIEAIFGKRWGRLINDGDNRFALLYGGIDSKEVTQRASEPSGAMGAIQRIMANDVACKNVALDFERPLGERRLFPAIDPSVVPDGKPETEKTIRAAIVYLYDRLHGRQLQANHQDVTRTYDLFTGIIKDAQARKGLNSREAYFCQAEPGTKATEDPYYTIRAWRAVVTYLLRQEDFLYE